jgi:hypothetical protein
LGKPNLNIGATWTDGNESYQTHPPLLHRVLTLMCLAPNPSTSPLTSDSRVQGDGVREGCSTCTAETDLSTGTADRVNTAIPIPPMTEKFLERHRRHVTSPPSTMRTLPGPSSHPMAFWSSLTRNPVSFWKVIEPPSGKLNFGSIQHFVRFAAEATALIS